MTATNERLDGEFDPSRYESLLDVMRYAAQQHGDRPAFSCFARQISYGELDRLSDGFARHLVERTGLKQGDRIAIQLPNLLQFPVALFGALKAGLVVVNTNPLYTSREMRQQFLDAGVRAVVILENFCAKLEEILEDTAIEHVFVTKLGDLQPGLQRALINFGARYIKKLVPSYRLPTGLHFAAALAQGSKSEASLPAVGRKGHDTALILYTGGTTGYAKGVMLSHANLLANLMQVRVRCLEIIRDRVESIVAPLPLYHSYAFLFHCVLMPYAGNHSILVPNPKDLDSVVAVLKRRGVTGFVGINTLYLALLQRDDVRAIDFKGLRFCGAGGMPLTRKVAVEWEAMTGCTIFEGYGLTECSPVVSVNSPSLNRPGTVGKPVVGTEIRVVDDAGTDVAPGEKGELWIRGPQLMSGYWNRPEDSAAVLTADGWLKSGDFVEVDGDGYIRIVDRKKDMILVSGFNVIPGEIEDYVNTHPQVLESAVIGVPSESTGEAVVLYVVCRKDSRLDADELRAFCKRGLTGYKLPREIVFAATLPKSNIGKVLRREIRQNHRSTLAG